MTYALLAALLFGASTPLAKGFVGDMPPVLVAGLLYLGSGIGLSSWRIGARLAGHAPREAPLARADWPWLAVAVMVGGALGPTLLLWGLLYTPAASASLLLNLEGVFTALIAWFVFRENFDRRIAAGMTAIVAAGGLLAFTDSPAATLPWPALAIVAACACWALDNNLTRKISGSDAVLIAAIKGLAAGTCNVTLALFTGPTAWPGMANVSVVLGVGFLGYGVSLVLFVLALRALGAARAAAYFSAAPFAGAVIALLLWHENPAVPFWLAAGLMAWGVWLHVSERHIHAHTHEALEHDHLHVHDMHHRHAHDFAWDGTQPHAHPHRHEAITHTHAHFPDLHHRHRHAK